MRQSQQLRKLHFAKLVPDLASGYTSTTMRIRHNISFVSDVSFVQYGQPKEVDFPLFRNFGVLLFQVKNIVKLIWTITIGRCVVFFFLSEIIFCYCKYRHLFSLVYWSLLDASWSSNMLKFDNAGAFRFGKRITCFTSHQSSQNYQKKSVLFDYSFVKNCHRLTRSGMPITESA